MSLLGLGQRPTASDRRSWGITASEEGELVAGLLRGDEAIYLSLTQRHSGAMLRIAKLYVSSHATAEDVVQETWLAVWNGLSRFEQRCSLKTWIFDILTNKARTASRRERRCIPDNGFAQREFEGCSGGVSPHRFFDSRHPQWPLHWKQPPLPWDRAAEDSVIAAEAVQVVLTAINDLPQSQRLVISLRDVECWTATEVCDYLGVSANNQRVLLHRARSTVRQRLETFHGNGRGTKVARS